MMLRGGTKLSVTVIFLLLYLSPFENSQIVGHGIECQCGTTGTTFKLPHAYDATNKTACQNFRFCDTCENGIRHCTSCPKERRGLLCEEKYDSETFQKANQTQIAKRRHTRGVNCHDLQPPKLGNVNCWFNRRQKECTGRCFPGHYFPYDGEEIVLKCGDNGRWHPKIAFPACASRGFCDLEMNGAGSYNCTTSSSGMTCTINCSGYPRVNANFFCDPGVGYWEPNLPHCARKTGDFPTSNPTYPTKANCPNPGPIANGKLEGITRQAYEEGSTVSYSCDNGYRLDGSTILECQSHGSWSPSPPTCRRMRITTTTTETPIERTVTCLDPGFVLNGERSNTDGSQSSLGQTFIYGDSVVFSCYEDFALHGSSLLTCQFSGRWSKPLPRCQNTAPVTVEPEERTTTCFDPGFIPNGQRWDIDGELSDYQESFGVGKSVVFSCYEGFSLHGGVRTITCLPSGSWSSLIPKCKRSPKATSTTTTTEEPEEEIIYCEDPGVDENGERQETEWIDARKKISPEVMRLEEKLFPVDSSLDFKCYDGYSLEGAKTITCQLDGLWSNVRPTCVPHNSGNNEKEYDIVYCNDPGYIADGRREVVYEIDKRRASANSEDEDEFPEGTKLVFSCEEDLELSGADTLTCTASGTWSSGLPECIKGCGVSSVMESRRITQGKATSLGQWPWQVGIARVNRNIFCGGVLINQDSILTAAHCVQGQRQQNLILYFGKYFFDAQRDDDKVLSRKVSSILIHPDFSSVTYDNDIAIVRFKPAIKFNRRIGPICLPNAETTRKHLIRGNKGWVTGWGLTENKTNPESLLMAYIPIVPRQECIDAYVEQRMIFPITDNMFCAGYLEGKVDSCNGDSGSPFAFYEPANNRFVLEGLVSFGVTGGCGVPKRYAVYTKVQRMIKWIRNNT